MFLLKPTSTRPPCLTFGSLKKQIITLKKADFKTGQEPGTIFSQPQKRKETLEGGKAEKDGALDNDVVVVHPPKIGRTIR
jgi:hypothetical protein